MVECVLITKRTAKKLIIVKLFLAVIFTLKFCKYFIYIARKKPVRKCIIIISDQDFYFKRKKRYVI